MVRQVIAVTNLGGVESTSSTARISFDGSVLTDIDDSSVLVDLIARLVNPDETATITGIIIAEVSSTTLVFSGLSPTTQYTVQLKSAIDDTYYPLVYDDGDQVITTTKPIPINVSLLDMNGILALTYNSARFSNLNFSTVLSDGSDASDPCMTIITDTDDTYGPLTADSDGAYMFNIGELKVCTVKMTFSSLPDVQLFLLDSAGWQSYNFTMPSKPSQCNIVQQNSTIVTANSATVSIQVLSDISLEDGAGSINTSGGTSVSLIGATLLSGLGSKRSSKGESDGNGNVLFTFTDLTPDSFYGIDSIQLLGTASDLGDIPITCNFAPLQAFETTPAIPHCFKMNGSITSTMTSIISNVSFLASDFPNRSLDDIAHIGQLRVTNLTGDSLVVSGTENSGFINFIFAGLTPSTLYSVSVPIDENQSNDLPLWDSDSNLVTFVTLDAPTAFNLVTSSEVVTVTSTTLNLSFGISDLPSSLSDGTPFSDPLVFSMAGIDVTAVLIDSTYSVSFSGLTPSTPYTMMMVHVAGYVLPFGDSSNPGSLIFATPNTPTAFNLLSSSEVVTLTSTTLNLSFGVSDLPSTLSDGTSLSYSDPLVFRMADTDVTDVTAVLIDTTYTVSFSGLTPSTQYTMTVQIAGYDLPFGDSSNPGSLIFTMPDTPTAFNLVTSSEVVTLTSTTLNLSFDVSDLPSSLSDGTPLSYNDPLVFRMAGTNVIATLSNSTYSVSFSGLSPSTQYAMTVQIAGYDLPFGDSSNLEGLTFTTTSDTPTAPTAFNLVTSSEVVTLTSTTLNLSFDVSDLPSTLSDGTPLSYNDSLVFSIAGTDVTAVLINTTYTVSFSGLSPSTQYAMTVQIAGYVLAFGDSSNLEGLTFTMPDTPTAFNLVTSSEVVTVTSTTLNLSFDVSDLPSTLSDGTPLSYNDSLVFRMADTDVTAVLINTTYTVSFSGLSPSTQYAMTVQIAGYVLAFGDSSNLEGLTFTMPDTPTAPTAFNLLSSSEVVTLTSTTLNLSFGVSDLPSTLSDGTSLSYSDPLVFRMADTDVTASLSDSTYSVSFSGLSPSTQYTMTVQIAGYVLAFGDSSNLEGLTFTTPDTPTAFNLVTSSEVVTLTSTTLNLSFDVSDLPSTLSDGTPFSDPLVFRMADTDVTAVLINTTYTVSFSGLSPSTQYTMTVQIAGYVLAFGDSSNLEGLTFTMPDTPTAFNLLSSSEVVTLTSTTLNLLFTMFDLPSTLSDGTPFSYSDPLVFRMAGTDVTASLSDIIYSVSFSGLTPSTQYAMTVQIAGYVLAFGDSSNLEGLTFTTPDTPTAFNLVTSSEVVTLTSTTLNLSFDVSDLPSTLSDGTPFSYSDPLVFRMADTDVTASLSDSIYSVSFSGLSPSTQYAMTVQVAGYVLAFGDSSNLEGLTFTTQDAPTEFILNGGENTTIVSYTTATISINNLILPATFSDGASLVSNVVTVTGSDSSTSSASAYIKGEDTLYSFSGLTMNTLYTATISTPNIPAVPLKNNSGTVLSFTTLQNIFSCSVSATVDRSIATIAIVDPVYMMVDVSQTQNVILMNGNTAIATFDSVTQVQIDLSGRTADVRMGEYKLVYSIDEGTTILGEPINVPAMYLSLGGTLTLEKTSTSGEISITLRNASFNGLDTFNAIVSSTPFGVISGSGSVICTGQALVYTELTVRALMSNMSASFNSITDAINLTSETSFDSATPPLVETTFMQGGVLKSAIGVDASVLAGGNPIAYISGNIECPNITIAGYPQGTGSLSIVVQPIVAKSTIVSVNMFDTSGTPITNLSGVNTILQLNIPGITAPKLLVESCPTSDGVFTMYGFSSKASDGSYYIALTHLTSFSFAVAPLNLKLDYMFTSDASQSIEYSILGELGGVSTYDQSISLDIPQATMNKLLMYSSNWTNPPGTTGSSGTQQEPCVTLALKSVVGIALDYLTAGLTGSNVGLWPASGDVVNGFLGSQCSTLVYEFLQRNNTFTYMQNDGGNSTGITCNYLANIPAESIQQFLTSVVSTPPLSQTCGDLVSLPSGSGITGAFGAVQSIFEQAIAAGMIPVDGTAKSHLLVAGTTYAAYTTFPSACQPMWAYNSSPIYGADWSIGQMLTIYVQFNLQKNRQYQLQALADLTGISSGATGATSIVFGGETFDCVLGDAAEISVPVPVVYQINLITV